MIAKLCAPMRARRGGAKGGSGLVEYLVGYAIAEKGASASEVRDALEGVYAEAAMRSDLGVGGAGGWSPTAGGGIRPSSVRVLNGCALEGVGHEIDSDAMMAPGVSSSSMHLVVSLPTAEGGTTDAKLHAAVESLLQKMGLGEHRALVAIHRDTLVGERGPDGSVRYIDGNLHAHIAVGTINPRTMMAYDRVGVHARLAWAAREVEIEFGLAHDRGLAVIRDAGTEHQRIEWSTLEERRLWARERLEDRLLAAERPAVIDPNEDWRRTANATIAPRIAAAVDSIPSDLTDEEAAAWYWSEAHATAARYGARIEMRDGAAQIVRVSDDEGAAWDDATGMPADRFVDAEQAEEIVGRVLDARPGIAIDAVAARAATWDMGDVHGWIGGRISDPDRVERIAAAAIKDDRVIVVASDSATPLFATKSARATDEQMVSDVRSMAGDASRGIANATMVAALQSAGIDGPQSAVLIAATRGGFGIVEAPPGAGKTTMMRAIAAAARADGREIVGCAIAQAAARNLASETGIPSINAARLLAAERRGDEVIPRRGGVLVIDEAGMMDSAAMGSLLRIARERGASVIGIGDSAQLRPVGAGDAFAAVVHEAKSAKTYGSTAQIFRQVDPRHRDAIAGLREAIIERDDVRREAAVVRAVRGLVAAGMVQMHPDRPTAMQAAATEIGEARASGKTALLLDSGRDGQRIQNEAMRAAMGIEGGVRRRTDGGVMRSFAPGDEVRITKNTTVHAASRQDGMVASGGFVTKIDGRGVAIPTWAESAGGAPDDRRKVEIINGDEGKVVAADARGIDVAIRGGETVRLPQSYRHLDHNYARTIHSAQGATVDVAAAAIDKATPPEAALVAVSRAREMGRLHVSGYATVDDFARDLARKIAPMRTVTAESVAEIVAQTGGRETLRVRSMADAAERLSAPMRQEYMRSVVEPMQAHRGENVAAAKAAYAQSDGGPDALRAMRKEIARAAAMSGPSPAAWAKDRVEARAEIARPKLEIGPEEVALRRRTEAHRAFVARIASQGEGIPDLLRGTKIGRLMRAAEFSERHMRRVESMRPVPATHLATHLSKGAEAKPGASEDPAVAAMRAAKAKMAADAALRRGQSPRHHQ